MEEMQLKFTEHEVAFIKSILTQLSISPASQDAVMVVGFVQSILQKLAASDKVEEPKG
jgi:hypothetical protein